MIRKAVESDIKAVAEMAKLMWTESSIDELSQGFAELISREDVLILFKLIGGVPIGFAQCQLRHDYVEGTDSSPVGYLEGIFIKEPYRRKGYAKGLLKECEQWAREKRCTEFASDCELENM